jgi:hypothetical protein
MTAFPDVPPGVDPTRPSPVRLYDYFLGGTHNYPVDREVAERLKATVPDIVDAMLANRGFHGRAARWIARQGVRQFIDIGAGLPTRNNTHEAVRRVLPEARVVYVDHDPMVAAYSGYSRPTGQRRWSRPTGGIPAPCSAIPGCGGSSISHIRPVC